MPQPTAPQRGERVRIVLETTFSVDASDSLGVVYVHAPSGATFGLPAADIVSVETIAPPKPPEPTGLGAVVEDAEGRKWVRTEWAYPWDNAGSAKGWEDLAEPVKVLSDGVAVAP